MSTTVYGIQNCDTVKKARKWLDERGVTYAFHDYRKDGVPEDGLRDWVARESWETVLNRRGTTFRKLDDADKSDIDANKAIALMIAHPSAIKRPIVEHGGDVLVGFDPDEWATVIR